MLSLVLMAGQRADCTQFEAVMERIRVPRQVTVDCGEHAATLVVTDNGSGFTTPAGSGSGIRGLQERVSALGGQVDVRDRPAAGPTGVVVTVTVPAGPARRR